MKVSSDDFYKNNFSSKNLHINYGIPESFSQNSAPLNTNFNTYLKID